jgi:hypothetical protein
MKTKRLVSTVGYNSPGFLAETLERLVSAGLVEWAHYIHHKAEEDETKDHWHIVLMPSRSVDTSALQRQFQEIDPANPAGKPLGVQPFRFSSKLDDWLLYAVHDKAYLASKGQTRKHHYAREDVRSTCPELLQEQWHEVNLAKYGLGEIVAEAVERHLTWEQAQWTFWREVYWSLRNGAAPRPLRNELTHDNKPTAPAPAPAPTKAKRQLYWQDGTPMDEDEMKMIEDWENGR